MKKTLAIFTVVAVLALGTLAFAHGGGGFGWGGGHMGPGMMGYGGHMTGWGPGYGNTGETREFLDKTADLRREFHEKRFEYSEALRSGDDKKAEKIAKELDELSEKLYSKAPKDRYTSRGKGWGGRCW
jgi:hypothetical protein